MTPRITGSGIEIPLPRMGLRLMKDSDERFVEQAQALAGTLYRLGLEDDHEVLDVGCSVGRLAIGLLSGTSFKGRYVGFDVMEGRVKWAAKTISPLVDGFHFRHIDVANDRYNKNGSITAADTRFPARTGGFHMACLFSIFTHFYAEDIEVYLRELRRCLRPGGLVVATWFLYDDSSLQRAKTAATYPMTHRLDEHTIYSDADDPLRAIAFHETATRDMIARAGLKVVDIEYGTWNGGAGPDFQDFVILRRPPKPHQPPAPRSLASRVRGRLARIVPPGNRGA